MSRTTSDVRKDIAATQSEMIAAALRLQALQAELEDLHSEILQSLPAAQAARDAAWDEHMGDENSPEKLIRWEMAERAVIVHLNKMRRAMAA